MAPHEAMMRAQCAADSNFYLNAMWTYRTSCFGPLNSATDGPAEYLKIGEWSSCWVSELGEDVVYSTPERRWLNHDRWYEIMIRAVFWRRVRRFIVGWFCVEEEDRMIWNCGFVFRRSVTAGSVEAAKFMGAAEEFMRDHREIHGSWVFGVEQNSMYRRLMTR